MSDPQRTDERFFERDFRYEEDEPTTEGRKRAARAWRLSEQLRDEREVGQLWDLGKDERN